MQEELIIFETAKLAKEKGFDERVPYGYLDLEEGHIQLGKIRRLPSFETGIIKNSETRTLFSSPTQSLLQKWLREVHKIIVQVECNYWDEINGWNTYSVTVFIPSSGDVVNDNKTFCFYKTYEKALERGLQEALKLIPDKQ